MTKIKLEEGKIIPASYDKVFKALLTADECKEYLADIIHIVTKIPKEEIIDNMEIKNSEHMKSHVREKSKVSDLIVDVSNNRINLECNKEYYEGLFSKNNAYQHKLAAEQLLSGENWIEEKKIIQINFDYFSRFDERTIIKFMIMDEERHLVETKNYEKYHVNLDLILKMYYNESDKLSKEEKKLLLLALNTKKEIEEIVKGDDMMEKAGKKLTELSEDEELIGMYDKELMERKIRNTMIKSAEIDAEKRGMARGMEKGLQKGIEQTQKQVVINMLNENINVSVVQKVTGLTENEIIDIKNSKQNT